MISISSSKISWKYLKTLTFVCVFLSLLALRVYAQEGQTLSVSPTLFQMSATPGQIWQSEVRVINVNKYDITVYPQVVNFAPKGESGRGDFIPILSTETGGQTLAEWIDLSREGITIAPQQTVVVPFVVHVPDNAAPGGHYAAILIGTKPSGNEPAESVVTTAQFVTALYFMRVAGDVTESGAIREFRTTQMILQKPDAHFEVRFQNTGNVHLQPQGDIEIFNMWGEERGTIPINHQTHFGNVLPNSIRKFEFAWQSEASAFDIGRYRAVVTLGYGEDTKNFVTSTTYFWIVPYKEIALLVGGLLFFLWFFTFAVKMYVRRMLLLSGISPNQLPNRIHTAQKRAMPKNTVQITRYRHVTAPVRTSVQEFTDAIRSNRGFTLRLQVIMKSLIRHWFAVVVVIAAIVLGTSVVFLWSRAHSGVRPYQVTIGNSDSPVTLSSESIYYENLQSQGVPPKTALVPEYADVPLTLINVSGELGVAAKLRVALESSGYTVSALDGDLSRVDIATKIIYHPADEPAALSFSKHLKGALLSADSNAKKGQLTIYVGTDQIGN